MFKASRLEAYGMSVVRVSVTVLFVLLLPSVAAAQSTSTASAPQVQQAGDPDPDLQLNPAEPDFTLGALPTTLRLPARKFAFRMTHRFSRPIGSGSAGEFFGDFFGFDSAARVGIEVRYGIRPGTQFIFHRTNNRAIQLLGQQQLLRQQAGRPVTIDALVAVEGANNLRQDYSGTAGVVISRQVGERAAFYVQPVFVSHTRPDQSVAADEHTMLLGIGTRLRIGSSRAYIVLEAAPQVGGYRDGQDHVSVGIEKRAGGHVFQFTVANSLGTTMRQIAQGGPNRDDWFIGFNLTRRFF